MKKKENTTQNDIKYHYLNDLLTHLSLRPIHFAKELGFDRADNIYHVLNGRNGISKDLAEIIIKVYPDVNYSWLLTGNGNMLNSINKEDAKDNLVNDNRTGYTPLSKDERIDRLILQNEKLIALMELTSITIKNLSYAVTGVREPKNAGGKAS